MSLIANGVLVNDLLRHRASLVFSCSLNFSASLLLISVLSVSGMFMPQWVKSWRHTVVVVMCVSMLCVILSLVSAQLLKTKC